LVVAFECGGGLFVAGGAIAMPQPLQDEQVEYEDGTPATISQMAKDVSMFLAFCAEPEHDYRKVSSGGSQPWKALRQPCSKGCRGFVKWDGNAVWLIGFPCCFVLWEQKSGVQWIGGLVAALLLTGFYKRFRWSTVKTAKWHYVH